MIISAAHVLEYVDATSVIKVIDIEGRDVFPADYERIVELATAGHVCGKVRGSKLKYLELLVPVSEAATATRQIERSASINARTNLGAYRQPLAEGVCWSLCFCRTLDGAST